MSYFLIKKNKNLGFFHEMSTPKQKIQCLCFDLTHLTSSNQFIILALAVFFFHCFQGFMHELIFRLPGFKPFSMYFTLVQFALYATYAFLDLIRKEGFNCFKSRRFSFIPFLPTNSEHIYFFLKQIHLFLG